MRILSFITLPSTVQYILLDLHLPHRPPRMSSARGPPQADFDFDHSPRLGSLRHDPVRSAFRSLPGSRPSPPSPTLRELARFARPDPALYLDPAPKRAFEAPIHVIRTASRLRNVDRPYGVHTLSV
jgi:hypothetical protein